jgi:septum formation inhibitor MinC
MAKEEMEKEEKEEEVEGDDVEIEYPAFIKEHEELVKNLRKVGHRYDNKELLRIADEQEKECEHIKEMYNEEDEGEKEEHKSSEEREEHEKKETPKEEKEKHEEKKEKKVPVYFKGKRRE